MMASSKHYANRISGSWTRRGTDLCYLGLDKDYQFLHQTRLFWILYCSSVVEVRRHIGKTVSLLSIQ